MSTTRSVALTEGWTLAETEPGLSRHPRDLSGSERWHAALVPGTVAAAIGPPEPDGHPSYDERDWWYRRRFRTGEDAAREGHLVRLRFDGLATEAEVWLNGTLVSTSSNMFSSYEVEVTDLVADENDLVIVFRSLRRTLSDRRPRPRWKTRLVDDQQIRWVRTTLLGRMPGWTPNVQPVGPWRSVWLETVSVVDVERLSVRTDVVDDRGIVAFSATVRPLERGVQPRRAVLEVGDHAIQAELSAADGVWQIRGHGSIDAPGLWWPRTHGAPALHPCALRIETTGSNAVVDCGSVGFRSLRLDEAAGRIVFVVNDVPIFCRGACWTPTDIVSLGDAPIATRHTLGLLADANANMVRVGGTTVYGSDDFYRSCDELGIMVWQDFMFANMDYPIDDAAFRGLATEEAQQQLTRLARHPSVVAFCGGSEIEQQAAMFGTPRECWSNSFLVETLPELVSDLAPGTPYWSSTPTGGALPFHTGQGLAHYYGVGAYRRPLEDARLAGVKFSPECLGFANVPEPQNLAKLTPTGAAAPNSPAWKVGVPRDGGAAWDFDDIRDHYLEQLHHVDATRLRAEDPERYLELSRVVTGQVMERVFSEWRCGSECGGGLVWFLRDVRPGAGWGIVDSDGEPKPVYYFLKRAWAPRCIRILDRGLDGLSIVVLNEAPAALAARIEVKVLARGSVVIAGTTVTRQIGARSRWSASLEGLLGRFLDPTHAYRFGPPGHEVVLVRLLDEMGSVVSQDVYRTAGYKSVGAAELDAHLTNEGDVELRSASVLHDVRLDVRGRRPADNYFVLAPDCPTRVSLSRTGNGRPAAPERGYVEALNLEQAKRLETAS